MADDDYTEEPAAESETPGEEAPEAPALDVAPPDEKSNLAAFLTDDEAKKYVRRCIDRYQRDLASREPRMRRLKELQERYAMMAAPKSFPWTGAANIRTPTVAGPTLQIQARLFDMLCPASGDLFSVVPATSDEQDYAHLGESFGNTYLRYHMPQYEQGMDFLIHEVCLFGSGFRRTIGDTYLRKVTSDTVGIEDFVVSAGHRSRDPSLSDVEFYTYVHRVSVAEIKAMGDGPGAPYVNTDKIKEEVNADTQASALQTAIVKQQGTDVDEEFEPHQVLECHCRYELPNAPGRNPAFDGKRHWLVVYIDWPSETILRMSLREEDDPDDVRRFERGQKKLAEYEQQLAQAQAAAELIAMGPRPQVGPDGMPIMDPMTGAPIMQPAAPPPPMPGPPPPMPPPVRKRQVCWFTHYRCFESGGFYGLGYGDILLGLAMAKDTILNQHVDGMTLKNAKPAFMNRNLKMQRGNVSVRPGEFIEVDIPVGAKLSEALMFVDPPDNDPSTVSLVQMLDGMSDILAGSADMMSGQVPGSNQAATSIQIFAEQAMTPITVLGRRLTNCLKHELYKVWRCFAVFLEDDEIQDIVREAGNPITENVTRAMFAPNARLIPTADPRLKSQRAKEFQDLMGFVMNSPVLAQNPASIRKLAELGLKLFPDGAQFAQLLPPDQPHPPPPPPMKPYWEEEAGYLNGQPSQVHPDDNDDEHIQGHMMGTPAEGMLPKPMRDAKEQHVRDHHAAKIRKGMGPIEQQKAALLGPSGEGPSPMAGPGGDQLAGGLPS